MARMRPMKKFLLILLLVAVVCIIVYSILDVNIKPVVMDMAQAKVNAIATKAFNDAVKEVFTTSTDTDQLMNVIFDNNGKATIIQADAVKMNKLATETAEIAQENIQTAGEQGIKIPMGSLFRSQMLAGRGPNIVVKMVQVGAVSTKFYTEFEQAGINLVQHKIFMQAETKVNIIIPTGGGTVKVTSYVPISETILVGEVPNSFVNVDDGNMMNLIPSSD